VSDEPLPPLANSVKAHDPGEIWELEHGGLGVVVSSRIYNESRFGTVVVCSVSTPPGPQQHRPLVVPAGADLAVYVDRITQIPTAWLVHRRGRLSAGALAEVDRHLTTLFMR
jgi:mRNA-degrading endonuclease toxin of MazEF toxin-antitoxin module